MSNKCLRQPVVVLPCVDASSAAAFSLRHSVSEDFVIELNHAHRARETGFAAIHREEAHARGEENTISKKRQGEEKADETDEVCGANGDAVLRWVDEFRRAAEVFEALVSENAVEKKRGGKSEQNNAATANSGVIADHIADDQCTDQEIGGRKGD